jgi:hypothetical protein
MVVFPDISFDQLRSKIIINLVSDGYASRTIDTLLSNFDPIDLTVMQAKIIRLSGTVKDAADRPIKDVEVDVDGTQYGVGLCYKRGRLNVGADALLTDKGLYDVSIGVKTMCPLMMD